ncbi:DNA cytosine methyltransferase [Thermomonospora umbrina]|uniref:DNA cytosine methyltransferase n=1 Tax=Thermomonospora umbrina TaxID=111806 RepID=UPI001B8839F7|nr:DNA cytosine methyltransferase [Thermomonospora umbrina]
MSAALAVPVNGMRLLDLFCCAGGAAVGYRLAGFEVTGVDIRPQPRYPFTFVQADALEVLGDPVFLAGFDAVHASPTCQRKARVTAWRGNRDDHPDTLSPTLRALEHLSVPWVVENVPEAADQLTPDYLLCGTQFGLRVRRHRIFQVGNWSSYSLLPPCRCYRNRDLVPFGHKHERAFADAMGCTWMTNIEGRQAIPPAYTRHIGNALAHALTERKVA